MSKTEGFGIGASLMVTAIAVILKSTCWAYPLFALGLFIAAYPFVRDGLYGTDRPSRWTIDHMTAQEYKIRCQADPKFVRWVNHIYKNKRKVQDLEDVKAEVYGTNAAESSSSKDQR